MAESYNHGGGGSRKKRGTGVFIHILVRSEPSNYFEAMTGPTLNLLKTAAGLKEIDELIARQKNNAFKYNGEKVTFAYTRFVPKRGAEIIESGGSIYWILKNRIQVRQKILGFIVVEEADGKDWCKIVVEPRLTQTYSVQKRAIQGWRYLEGANVPKDRGLYTGGNQDDMPPQEMAEELKKLGLL